LYGGVLALLALKLMMILCFFGNSRGRVIVTVDVAKCSGL